MNIRAMQAGDFAALEPMMRAFYASEAMDHPLEPKIFRADFDAAVRGDSTLRGLVLEDEGGVFGFSFLTIYFSSEVGGETVQIEDLYIDASRRGRGYGRQYFEWVFARYPRAKRFRLEVSQANRRAARLYERLGFSTLPYQQMVIDRA